MAFNYVIIRILLASVLLLGFDLGATGKVLCIAENHTTIEELNPTAQDSQGGCGYCFDMPIKSNVLVNGDTNKFSREKDTPLLKTITINLSKNLQRLSHSTSQISYNYTLALLILKTVVLLN